MTDTFTPEQRSHMMSKIRARNTNPELIVRKYLHSHGFRYRLYKRDLPGHPDIVLSKFKTVIFVHGCFWHAHNNCKYFRMPKSNSEYWVDKINKNVSRDLKNQALLREMGWKVIVIWECELKRDSETRCSNLIDEIVDNHGRGEY